MKTPRSVDQYAREAYPGHMERIADVVRERSSGSRVSVVARRVPLGVKITVRFGGRDTIIVTGENIGEAIRDTERVLGIPAGELP